MRTATLTLGLLACDALPADVGDSAAPAPGPATGCPELTGFAHVGDVRRYRATYAADSSWSASTVVSGLADDGAVTVIAVEGNDGSDGNAESVVSETRVYRCDDGLALVESTTTLRFAGTDHPPSRLVFDLPYPLLPAELTAGASWTVEATGTRHEADGSTTPWVGPRDTWTVEGSELVSTPALVAEAWSLAVEHDDRSGGVDAIVRDRAWWAPVAGLVAVEGGGTQTARELVELGAH